VFLIHVSFQSQSYNILKISQLIENITLRSFICIFSALVFSFHMRDNEILTRSFYDLREDNDLKGKTSCILRILPDGVLFATMDKVLYLNDKA
jgi:hypothetical protein